MLQKNDIYRLPNALELPRFYKCTQWTMVTGIEALMIPLGKVANLGVTLLRKFSDLNRH